MRELVLGTYLFACAVGFFAVLGMQGAHAGAHVDILYKQIYEDQVRNWDYHDHNVNNNDMPVDLFFTNGATIETVDSAFKPLFPQKLQPGTVLPRIPDPIYSQVMSPAESAGFDNETNGRNSIITHRHHFIDSSRGMKDYACGRNDGNGLAHHVRVYAPQTLDDGAYPGFQPDSLYTRQWGYYVFATSHEDHNEKKCTQYHKTHGMEWFGNSEDVERYLTEALLRHLLPKVYGVYPNKVWMNNRIGWPFGAWDGDHLYKNNGWATRFVLRAGASASSVSPLERTSQFSSAALTRFYDYHHGGGSGDHWTTTGPAESEWDVLEQTLGFLENIQVPGTAPLYECNDNVTEHFLSRDVSCAPGDLEGLAGYIYMSPSAGTPALYSCHIAGEIYESNDSNCEGFSRRGLLGYLKGSAPLRRSCCGNGVDHHIGTGPDPAGGMFEMTLGRLVQGPVGNRHPLFSCRAGNNPRDHFLSTDRGCEGNELLALEGYAYDSPPPGVPTMQIYRCWYPGGHFVSPSSNCEGKNFESSLGYTYNP